MLLGRLRIRNKLALLVVIPLLSMVGLAVPVVLDRIAVAQRAADIADRVRVASRIGSLVQDLQQERILSVGLLLGRVSPSELVQKSAAVDDRVADLRATRGESLPSEVAAALDEIRTLADLRAAVLAGTATPDEVMDAYGPVNLALIDSLRLPFTVDTNTAAGRQVLALDGLLRTDEALGACATLVVLVKATNDPAAIISYVASVAALQVDNLRFRSLITAEQYELARLNDAAVTARTSPDFLSRSLLDPVGAVRHVPLEALFRSAQSMITLGQFVEKKIVADVIAEVTAEQRRALTVAYLVGAAALLVLSLVLVLSVAVARTVARPLSRLTRSADRVARVAEAELTRVADDESETGQPVRLDPVDVRARDEIGDLARAFERVQTTAARLVERQVAGRRNVAQMFGHVGRRTQNLVGRQLALIDRLERQETDPARLEHLYRLDHISSRLRRNASSLVALSGSTGDDPHVAPVRLADVVRLALGEIEDYTRVDVQVPTGASVSPGTVGDLVLALAELMENATVFSPPHTRVVVGGELTGAGARLSVVDRGIGMTAERLYEENARLARRERLDLAPSEVLGLFVVGRLARRHGWAVHLAPTVGGGVTAQLELPPAALVPRPVGRAGATVARVVVPDRDRRSPAGSSPLTRQALAVRQGRSRVGDHAGGGVRRGGAAAPSGFDPVVLRRATRTVAAGESWDAFAVTKTQPEATGHTAYLEIGHTAYLEISAPAGPALPPGPASAPASPDPAAGLPLGPRAAPPGPRAAPPAASGHAAVPAGLTVAPAGPPPNRAPARVAPLVPGIRQRVPGASLPPAGPRVGPADAVGADPAAARELVEAVESGVRRAELAHPHSAPPTPGGPSGAGPAGASPTYGRPRLTRRVPGAGLTSTPVRLPASHGPGDPAEVRDLITEFEAGVARALREVSPDRRDEEGSSR
ncbi:nitrate- and nitrite sensing domain-containing protein [Micromonospora sp. WMMA1363]|uniref:sensor histidine kinase n=1 Tax=Micromonospora sp. WMMA1363 TaxID=3053985 RepID=UPI00259C89F4|nr:nitrate- and nitrite sensing domain-containing protein [Micromonospora sp. WMMA1363]MDM4721081.1 nitrate- and nitrite sensing domain-containing protein [Micromonospora sp. WMMA1363]